VAGHALAQQEARSQHFFTLMHIDAVSLPSTAT
jgi:hypothetical protein